MPYMSPETGARVVKLVIGCLIVQLLLLGYVFYQSYEGRVDLVGAQRAACERGKLDRTDNADFQRAHTTYIIHVTDAQSVEEDVKKAARQAVKTFKRTSEDLSKRAKIHCAEVFPKASIAP